MSHLVLVQGPAAASQAREHVRERLGRALHPSRIADAELMTSELVANALQHADLEEDAPVGLDIDLTEAAVRVTVVDAGPGFDAEWDVPTSDPGGWGLVLVARISDRWGIHSAHPHSVWFEIDR